MVDTSKPTTSADPAFDELERLIASELVDLDNWDDDVSDFDTPSINTNKGDTPAATRSTITDNPLTYEAIDDGHGLRLHLDGKIGFHSRPQMVHLISDIRTGMTKHYDLDFTNVAAISLIGISLLTLLIDATAERKIEITLSNCHSDIYQTLCWAGLNKRVLVASI